jgi:(p)ppGpp synthase/HD superfamily hydrolase
MQESNKEITIQNVIEKRKEHSRKIDSKLIIKAYNYAVEHHGNQCRHSRRAIYNTST